MPSIRSNFLLKDEDVERIRQSILRCGTTSEKVINDYLHKVAGKKFIDSMSKYIPRSNRKNVIHAKGGNWSEQENFNLAVSISNSLKGKRGSSFYYLYYVVTGTGTNKKKGPRDFMKQGMDQEYDNVVDGILNELSENIEKEMKV